MQTTRPPSEQRATQQRVPCEETWDCPIATLPPTRARAWLQLASRAGQAAPVGWRVAGTGSTCAHGMEGKQQQLPEPRWAAEGREVTGQ